MDLRARLDITHIKGSHWEVLGDFRLRLAPSDQAARGYLGGNENDLTEMFAAYRGEKIEIVGGRQIMRGVDATTIDGLSMKLALGGGNEFGAFGGLYPNPFSRTFDTDYPDVPFAEIPVAAGTWFGYRSKRLYGTIGFALISAQFTEAGLPPDPLRAFVSASGYAQVTASGSIILYHYAAFDIDGPMGATFTNLNLGGAWRIFDSFRLEAGISHMSTHALAYYVRKYFEAVDPNNVGRIQNNLFVTRTASDEARVGGDLSFGASKVDLFAQVRFRQRSVLDDPQLPAAIASLPADNQIEVSGGVRAHDVGGFLIGVNGSWIHGDRSDAQTIGANATHGWNNEKVQLTLDATYLHFQDFCDTTMNDPTCLGFAKGDNFEVGGTLVWMVTRTWLLLADEHVSYVKSTSLTVNENIIGNTLFVRAQRSF
jgi:hypothetical protein